MIVVVHQAIGMTKPVVPFYSFIEDIEEVFAILVIPEYVILGISPGCYVIDRPGVFDTQRSGHGIYNIAYKKAIFQDRNYCFSQHSKNSHFKIGPHAQELGTINFQNPHFKA
jgi:hypothetical protein